jgi:hypothetical protein
MQPISIVWVILLLLALAVIIGPVDYFVLKRRDRLPLTWLTFTAYIVVFSVAAYFGVKALRGGKTQFRAVSVIDGVEGDPGAWHCCTSAIFAPESDDYRLSGLARGQWWASLAPSSGEYLYASGRRGTRGITCTQEDGGNLPTYLPISIWSMQCLLTESACDDMPITAQVQRDLNTLHATVTNRSDWPILRGTIRVDGDRVVPFGTIPPRSSAKVDGTLVSAASWSSELSAEDSGPPVLWAEPAAALKEGPPFCAQGTLRRTQAILNRLEQGAAVVCAEYQQAPLAYGLADRRHQVVHRQWVRLLVVPGKGPPS